MYPILTPVIDFQCFFHLLPVLDLFKHFSRLSFARVPYVSFKLLCLEGLKGFKGDSNRLHGLIRGYMGYIRLKGLQGKPGVTRKYRRIQGVTRGYKGFRGLQEVKRGYTSLQGVTGGYKRLQWVTEGYRGLKGVRRRYKGLQGVTGSYRGLRVVTGGYRGLQKVKRGYSVLQRVTRS